jgi:Pectate lyase superfamily protein
MRLLRIVALGYLVVVAVGTAFAVEVSVKDFGAKGDGKTDDRSAIQAAVDAVNKAGGGIVNFPEGVYVVTAPNKYAWESQVKLCNNLKLRGEGMVKSVVKIADNQGAYDVIFAGRSLHDFSMLDLGMDANGATNPFITKAEAVRPSYLHTPLYLPDAKDITIQRCRFTNLSGVWAVYITWRAENVVVDSCLFDNIGGYTKNDFDHSCIRIDGYGPCVVSNNIMTSRFGAGTTGARTAVEIHGSNHKFINNLITGFRYGINVCSGGDGKTTDPSVHQYYMGNKLVLVGCGFSIWGIDNRKYDNLVFERNDITIDIAGWKKFFPEFYGIGIVSYRGTNPPTHMENVRIADNHITYINSEGGTTRSSGMRFDFAIFTDRWSENPSGQMTNVQILRNTISGAYASGIDLNCVAKNVEITENTFIDPARGVSDKELRSAIRLRDSVENVRIVNNAFYTQQPKAIAYGIYDAAKCLGGCVQEKNRVLGTGAADVSVYFANPARKGAEWNMSDK